ncbi:MAG: transcription elongation factor GreA [Nocardioides sp.]|nr:transcription elongation factor GreA [Nocardioides sp.]
MTQSTEQATIWLIPSAKEQLEAELQRLEGPVRDEIVQRISEARDEGDLKENGGYHAAREEQGKNEGQIKQLQALLRSADSTLPSDDGVVSVGKVVTYKFEGDDDDEAETFLLGSRENEEYVDMDVFSAQAPLGAALLGAKAGDTVAFEAPNGKTLQVVVVKATPYTD